MSPIRCFAVLLAITMMGSSANGQVRHELIAQTGMATPSGGTLELRALDEAVVNRNGVAAFIGEDVDQQSGMVTVLWLYDGLGISSLLAEGDVVGTKEIISDIEKVYLITDAGDVICRVLCVSGNRLFLRVFSSGSSGAPQVYLSAGPTGTVGAVNRADFTRAGDAAFETTSPNSIITFLDGTSRTVFVAGTQAPGRPMESLLTGTTLLGIASTETGPQAVVMATWNNAPIDNDAGMFLVPAAGAVEGIISENDPIAGGASGGWVENSSGLIRAVDGAFVFPARITNPQTPNVLVRWAAGELSVLASGDEVVPDLSSGFPPDFFSSAARRTGAGGSMVSVTNYGLFFDSLFSVYHYPNLAALPRRVAGVLTTGGTTTTIRVNAGSDAVLSGSRVAMNSAGEFVLQGTLESGHSGVLFYSVISDSWTPIDTLGAPVQIDQGPFAGQSVVFTNIGFPFGYSSAFSDTSRLLVIGQESATVDLLAILDLRSLPSAAIPADLDGDARVDIEDLYHIHQNPEDINGDGVADAEDRRALERYLRRFELEDMTPGRR